MRIRGGGLSKTINERRPLTRGRQQAHLERTIRQVLDRQGPRESSWFRPLPPSPCALPSCVLVFPVPRLAFGDPRDRLFQAFGFGFRALGIGNPLRILAP